MNDTQDQLDDLLASLCDGTIDAAAFARLEAMLSADESARRKYILMMELHAELAYSDGALKASHAQNMVQENAILSAIDSDLHTASAPAAIGNLHWIAKAAMIALVPAVMLALAWGAGWFASEDDAIIATLSPATDATFQGTTASDRDLLAGRVVDLQSGRADLTFRNGAHLTATGNTSLRIDSPNSTTLMDGTLSAVIPPGAVGFTVQTTGFRVIDLGTRFTIQVAGQGGQVRVDEGLVEVVPHMRLPRLLLSFDEASEKFNEGILIDSIQQTAAKIQGKVKTTQGIVGAGAMDFVNEPDSRINLGNGGGGEIGTGLFAVRDGITIELLMIPRWSGQGWSTRTAANPDGRPYDYDQIFRKEDGDHRIVLSFQDDNGAGQKIDPVVDPGPCLTFGLYLEETGYSELDMPLDGQEGRPTLAYMLDGKPHHVVASYDAATGIKAIYIDGTLRFRHRFKPGLRILSGGKTDAALGNAPYANEAFTGVIDEFAFYDVALTPAEVIGHWRNVQRGLSYFGGARMKHMLGDIRLESLRNQTIAVIPLRAGESLTIDGDTRLPIASPTAP